MRAARGEWFGAPAVIDVVDRGVGLLAVQVDQLFENQFPANLRAEAVVHPSGAEDHEDSRPVIAG
ncbi:Uncharacterised protein [Mycobacteroides abscessus subsp. abscessus]|nr:Uncharacterised protein [Mycobacteroides abscessus subsp. abscessus]SKY59914.1 Uncharacterised protein [Mycobacteroides abscessus subsp. abscessus]